MSHLPRADGPPPLAEDPYGRRKRWEFVAEAIRALPATRVLDVGCGTGANLTLPLAEAFPDARLLGLDRDADSIARARSCASGDNVRFEVGDLAALADAEPFDLVIASEVLEHVDDPPGFLAALRARTRAGGRVVLTVPNGYGPFELSSVLEVLVHLSGVRKRLGRGAPPPADAAGAATLATSPHAWFFTRGDLGRLFDAAGLRVRRFRPTTFLCGYGLDPLLASERRTAWNARVADRLPAWCASDWMFELEPAPPRPAAPWRPRRGTALRRRLNRRRWGLE